MPDLAARGPGGLQPADGERGCCEAARRLGRHRSSWSSTAWRASTRARATCMPGPMSTARPRSRRRARATARRRAARCTACRSASRTSSTPTTCRRPTARWSMPGHRPANDTAVVSLLRLAGAVILGKCVTTEFASPVPIGTRNPHDLARSPGVSSSGCAAAVADFMVPLAVGSQTGGSTILPAAFCGVVGYKASLTGIDRGGIRHLRPTHRHHGAVRPQRRTTSR